MLIIVPCNPLADFIPGLPDVHTHTRLTALCPGLPRWAYIRKVKPIWILLKQETVSGSGISWAICKCAPRSRQITMPAAHHSVFYRPDALPAAQPTASNHWRDRIPDVQCTTNRLKCENCAANYKIFQEHQLNSGRFPVFPGATSNSRSCINQETAASNAFRLGRRH